VSGIRKIYEKKYTHYEVMGVLGYFSQAIVEFNSSQLKEASAYVGMLHGAQHGIIEYINALTHANPDLLLAVDSCYRGIFSYAIMYRKQNVFQLMHGLEGRKEIFRRYRIDTFGNNILHLAAHLGLSSDRTSRSDAALQMQREIQWFKVTYLISLYIISDISICIRNNLTTIETIFDFRKGNICTIKRQFTSKHNKNQLMLTLEFVILPLNFKIIIF